MGQYYKIIFLAFWFPQAFFQLIEYLYWIQVKEYRYDRIISFLRTQSGRDSFGIIKQTLKFIALYAAFINFAFLDIYVAILAYASYLYVSKYLSKKAKKPVFTLRIVLILLFSLVLLAFLSIFSVLNLEGIVALFAVLETALMLSGFAGLIITSPLVNFAKLQARKAAVSRLHKVKPKIVGITGSFGKTTTKDFVYQILSASKAVEKTVGSENTEFGIFRKIARLKESTEVFVMEVGAYKRGEIKKVVDYIQPGIAIITGIEPQHLELFGSLDNLFNAKYELIQSLPKDGLAIINFDSLESRKLYRKARKNNITTLTYGIKSKTADLLLRPKSSDEHGVIFDVSMKGIKQRMFAPVPGVKFLQNIGAAVLVARHLNVSWGDIIATVDKLTMPEKTMNVTTLGSGAVFVDDTFNSSPAGFVNALEYLDTYVAKRKVVITPGLIELGSKTLASYTKVAKKMKNIDLLIVTKQEALGEFRQYNGKVEFAKDHKTLLEIVSRHNSKDIVFLAEGRLPSGFLKEIV